MPTKDNEVPHRGRGYPKGMGWSLPAPIQGAAPLPVDVSEKVLRVAQQGGVALPSASLRGSHDFSGDPRRENSGLNAPLSEAVELRQRTLEDLAGRVDGET